MNLLFLAKNIFSALFWFLKPVKAKINRIHIYHTKIIGFPSKKSRSSKKSRPTAVMEKKEEGKLLPTKKRSPHQSFYILFLNVKLFFIFVPPRTVTHLFFFFFLQINSFIFAYFFVKNCLFAFKFFWEVFFVFKKAVVKKTGMGQSNFITNLFIIIFINYYFLINLCSGMCLQATMMVVSPFFVVFLSSKKTINK